MSEPEILIRELINLLERIVSNRGVNEADADLMDHIEDWLRRQARPLRPSLTVIAGGKR